ncbi:unnamed protein product [Gongylonema pulchrum]|uniref:MIT domain-containing protein n=1 Tax=Gongylonema pulchrum TaxID=637853 RepID=A0A183DG76_9BILA|nr:unnamed protein product [Gongylonema pulchrum]
MDRVLALTAAYEVYTDVSKKAEEGLKFYSTLFSLVRNLDEAVEAIEIAYAEEKDKNEKEMLRALEERTNARVSGRNAGASSNTANEVPIANGDKKSSDSGFEKLLEKADNRWAFGYATTGVLVCLVSNSKANTN